ncbi:MAG: hypothetical protein JEZ11_16425 [Desulfobacterales bacterium]|nr:hypothetical protein [Desulfobacterales bacterium]
MANPSEAFFYCYWVREYNAHYRFTIKNNQPGLFQDISLYFMTGKNPILSIANRLIMAGSKSER